MIYNFLHRVPAGMMVVPMLLGAFLNTFFPEALKIGSFTTATFSSAGAATAMGIQLFCLGTTMHVRSMPAVIKRGGVLLVSKFVIGAVIGIAVGKLFGMDGILGLTTLAIISSVTNSNGSLYLALCKTYGDDADCAAMPLLAINDGPFLTLIALGASGMADIPLLALVATLIPILAGMLIGNIDKKMAAFFSPAGGILIPFVGLCLGAGMNLKNIVAGGFQGILLGAICCFVGGAFIVLCDRFISRRPGYAGWAVASTAGNAVAVPAAVGLIDARWQPYVETATVQVAAAAVFTALVVPFVTSWWVKRYGSPQNPLPSQTLATS